MSLYRVTPAKLEPVPRTTFAVEKLLERKDLQRLLRSDIRPIGDDLMVIAEEFGEWEDSSRRIDLLCLNRAGSLVVVEIKRTEDGGHMELQALRYAAMVSSMTLEQAIGAYAKTRGGDEAAARSEVLAFLRLDSAAEAELTGDVRIVLVSADFSTELATTVLWLNKQNLDITCIRLRPHRMGDEILIDATQIIPLPEAADYEVRLRAQEQEKKKVLSEREEILTRFWPQFLEAAKKRTQLFDNRTPTSDHWINAGIGRTGFSLNVALTKHEVSVECYIRSFAGVEATVRAFDQLNAQKVAIEKQFGEPLDWQEDPESPVRRIKKMIPGGWKAAESQWPQMLDQIVDAVVRLEAALRQPIQELVL